METFQMYFSRKSIKNCVSSKPNAEKTDCKLYYPLIFTNTKETATRVSHRLIRKNFRN